MSDFENYLQRKRFELGLANKVNTNIALLNKLSDDEIRLERLSRTEAELRDPAYKKIIKLMEKFPDTNSKGDPFEHSILQFVKQYLDSLSVDFLNRDVNKIEYDFILNATPDEIYIEVEKQATSGYSRIQDW